MLLLVLVNFGRIVLERGVIGLENYTLDQLVVLMEERPQLSAVIGAAGILRLLGGLAIPIFALLVTEGFLHTSNLKAYAVRVAILALAAECVYDYALTGRFFSLDMQNPVFSVLLCLATLSILRLPEPLPALEKNLCRILVILFAVIWAMFLHAEYGVEMVLLCAAFFLFRDSLALKTVFGVLISLLDPIGPFAFCGLFFYNGKREMKSPKLLWYGIYFAHLLLFGAYANMFLR